MKVLSIPSPCIMKSSNVAYAVMVWCGVVWCGVVWCGVAWHCVVWCCVM